MRTPDLPQLFRSAAWLALVLTLVACGAGSGPAATGEPAGTGPEPEGDPPSPTPYPAIELPDLGPAPDIANETWLNSDRPLNLDALRGKVVLVEFWTFG